MSRLLAWHFLWLACSPRWCISRPDNLKIHILYDIVVKCQNLVNLITSIELYPLKPVWWLLHFRGPRITVQKVVCSCCWKCQSTNCAFLFSCLRSDKQRTLCSAPNFKEHGCMCFSLSSNLGSSFSWRMFNLSSKSGSPFHIQFNLSSKLGSPFHIRFNLSSK